ncbi:MAG: hypothetical protein HND58_13010 [Planctomycetota bacterium]|nr:MAG: hypothetical protein HND58_13010 [Planctomycetota bacterium]
MTTGQLADGNGQDQAWLHEKLLLVADLVGSDPKTILCDKEPAGEPGLACEAINKRARRAGLIGSDQFIIEPYEEPSGDAGVQRPSRWIRFHHPDSGRPVIDLMVRDSYSVANSQAAGHGSRIAAYLRAWAEHCDQEPPDEPSPGSNGVGEPRAHQPGLLPTPIVGVAVNLGDVLDTAAGLRANVALLERACSAGELPEDLRRSSFPDPGAILLQEEVDRLRGRPGWDEGVRAIRATRQLRAQIPALLDTLPTISPWVDDTTKPAQERWTAVVAADLRRLNGCALRGQPRDAFPSDLPWLDQGVADALGEVLERLEECWNQLQAIERCRATPISLTPGSLSTYSGDLDASEAAAVIQLGDRKIWGVDELPETIDADMLRCLDRHGFIDARSVNMQNRQKFPGDKTPSTPSPGVWFSPIRQPTQAGDWEAVVSRHERDSAGHPSQVRLSDLGKAERAKTLRVMGGDRDGAHHPGSTDASKPDGNVHDHLGELAEERVKHELDGISETTFLSESDLATTFNIRQSTLRGKLPGWRKSHMNNDWLAVQDRRPKDPHYLYRVLSIYPLIEDIRRAGRGSA